MTRAEFKALEGYMLDCMRDSAHDSHHVYRVLYMAADIARGEENVDFDVLTAACLLHDIGRLDETLGLSRDHALAGAQRAYSHLLEAGYPEKFAAEVRECVRAHRYRSDNPPESVEAKILFDSDKLDVTGMIGIARTFMYGAVHSQSIYTLDENGGVSDGVNDTESTFFREYKFKLEGIYDRFFTKRGRELAEKRRAAAKFAYDALYEEASLPYAQGKPYIEEMLGD